MIKEGKTNLPSWLLMAAMVTQRRHSQCWATEFGVNDVYGGRGRLCSCYRNRCRAEESADERRSVVGGGATLMESKQRQIQKNIGRYQERFTMVLWLCFSFTLFSLLLFHSSLFFCYDVVVYCSIVMKCCLWITCWWKSSDEFGKIENKLFMLCMV